MSKAERHDVEVDLSKYFDVLLRRRWIVLAVLLLVFLSAAVKTFTTRPVYESSSLMVIEKERGGGNATAVSGTIIESSNEDYYQTQYKLLKSESMLQRVYDDLKLQATEDFGQPNGLRKLDGAILISPIARSRLLYVKVQSHDPQLAARVANRLCGVFVEENLNNQLFISKEILQVLQGDKSGTRGRLYDSLPAVVNNTLIQTLKTEYAKLQAQAADMSGRYTPKHPLIVSIHSNMAALQGQIQLETERVVQSVKTELSGQLKGNNVRIIDEAKVPAKPIKPKKRLALIVGFLAGVFLGFLAALLVEILDQSIYAQEDVESKLGLPFLGLIPLSAQPASHKVYSTLLEKSASLTSESFRNLRTMLDFALATQKNTSLLVTSSVQEEGKTFVASNLAVVFTQKGERVLLIDGDMRRPKIHRNFRISNEHGISDFLISGSKPEELAAFIQKTDVPDLHVLPCGPRPPNPSELLNTPRLSALVAWAQEHYDRVVVDCTPMFPISDTLLWGRQIPATLFVARFGRTRASLIRTASDALQSNGIKVLGVAVNAATSRGLKYAAYGQYYYYYQSDYMKSPEVESHAAKSA